MRSHVMLSAAMAHVIVTAVMTWPYVNYGAFGSASYGGDHRLIIWTLAWDNRALVDGLSLFDSNIFYPAAESLRYNEHLFGVSVFALPWRLLGASPVLAHNATWWLGLVLNGVAAFAFIRSFVKEAIPAFLGSLVYAWSFYVMLHAHGHLHLVWVWTLPLSLLFLMRWFDQPRLPRLLGWLAVIVVGVLTSWYVAVMVLLVNGILFTVLAACRFTRAVSDGRWRTRTRHLLFAAVVTTACVFPFARPYIGLRGTADEAAAFSADLGSYVSPPDNTVTGRWWREHVDARPRPIWGERTVFAGWIALALAGIGVLSLASNGRLKGLDAIFPALVVAGFVLSVGPAPSWPGGGSAAPFAWLAALPGLEGMRAPARFALVVMLGLSGLAAFGAAVLSRLLPLSGRPVVLILVPAMLFEWFVVDFPAGKPQPIEVPAIYRTPEVLRARSLVSLPEYTGAPDWFLGADYLYYSMTHWRPIVNGFGRTGPAGHDAFVRRVRAFPHDLDALREAAVQYVVLHADRYPDGARDILADAAANDECRLVSRLGTDYLFEVLPPKDRPRSINGAE